MERNFCPHCGERFSEEEFEGCMRDYCVDCDEFFWRNPKPFAGVLVVQGNEILIVERNVYTSKGKLSFPAGYMEEDETPEDQETVPGRYLRVRMLEMLDLGKWTLLNWERFPSDRKSISECSRMRLSPEGI